jgi:Tfp pilus assembly protein PilX
MKQLRARQEGFVSIIMALVIMVLVSLIGLGFAFLARQNQEQNQNRLLSTQAFYAAETGVNDTVDYISKELAKGNTPPNQTVCGPAGSVASPYPETLGSSNDEVKYTCVLYNLTPPDVTYPVTNTNSTIIRIQPKTGNLTSLTISWQDSDTAHASVFATNGKHLLPEDTYSSGNGNDLAANGTGILRATIIPISDYNRTSLTTNTQTLFLYPVAGAVNAGIPQPYIASTSPGDQNQGVFSDGDCNVGNSTKEHCSVTITGLNNNLVYLRLRTLYRPSSTVSVCANSCDGSTQLVNEQAIVDVTGKANNVLRRVQVRVPLSKSTNRPEFALETTDSICKRMEVYSGGLDIFSPTISGFVGRPDSCNTQLPIP